MTNPQRNSNIVSQPMGDGLGVFDPQLQKSYMLNATSALVFQLADGQTTVKQLSQRLRQKFNVPASQAERMLWLSLNELEKANLLKGTVTTQAPQPMLTRRQALTAFAAAGLSMALMPIVAPLSNPHAAPMAQGTTGEPTTGPLMVHLVLFEAIFQVDAIQINWQTTSELDNLGFNLYRATSLDEEREQLNDSLIPSQVPGSGQGAAYSFRDESVEAGVTYYYWLEDVAVDGSTTSHAPISATASTPTAVSLQDFQSHDESSGVLALLMASTLASLAHFGTK